LRATGAYPIRQDMSQWLGSNLIGAKVVSASQERIGRIANLVVNDDGNVEAAVISIGGLFGMGAKEVAVTYKSLNIVRDKSRDGIDHIVLAATRNDLRQAADFKTLREQKAEKTAHRTQDAPVVPVKMTTPPP
jgi:sporulation protein YlmC with PRC-barrel domain